MYTMRTTLKSARSGNLRNTCVRFRSTITRIQVKFFVVEINTRGWLRSAQLEIKLLMSKVMFYAHCHMTSHFLLMKKYVYNQVQNLSSIYYTMLLK